MGFEAVAGEAQDNFLFGIFEVLRLNHLLQADRWGDMWQNNGASVLERHKEYLKNSSSHEPVCERHLLIWEKEKRVGRKGEM